MFEYVAVCIIFSSLIACLMKLMGTAPSRLKFRLALIAISVWFIPWQWLNLPTVKPLAEPVYRVKIESLGHLHFMLTPAETQASQAGSTESIVFQAQRQPASDAQVQPLQSGTTWLTLLKTILLTSCLLGLVRFLLSVFSYRKDVRQWYRESRPADELKTYLRRYPFVERDVDIRLIDSPAPGMTSGIFRPVIWLGRAVDTPKDLESVLLHEYCHIVNRDTLWAWLLHCIRNVFWWHPIIWIFCEKAATYMESSCDEMCVRWMDRDMYACSIIEMTLKSQGGSLNNMVLGLRKSNSEIVKRMRSLHKSKPFRVVHGATVVGVFTASILLAILVTYDKEYFVVKSEDVEPVARPMASSVYQVSTPIQPFFEITQLLKNNQLKTALTRLEALRNSEDLPGVSEVERQTLLFNVSAMVYGDLNRYDKIIQEFETSEFKEEILKNKHGPRILAIAHIKLGAFEKALSVLSTVKFKDDNTGPTKILYAQASFLAGRYQDAISYAKRSLALLPDKPFNQFAFPLYYQVLAKSALAIGDEALLKSSLQALELEDASQLASISFTNQRLPYLYFQYAFIDGRDVSQFDQIKFPLPDKLLASRNPSVQAVLNEAALAFHNDQLKIAIDILQRGYQRLITKIGQTEQAKMLEFLFVLQLNQGSSDQLFRTAEALSALPGVRRPLLLRALYILSNGSRKDSIAHIGYFERYIALVNEPSLASDHMILKRYFSLENDQMVLPALKRISEFYESNNYVPDVRTINHLISLYKKIGDTNKSDYYRELMLKHYPRSYNYILG